MMGLDFFRATRNNNKTHLKSNRVTEGDIEDQKGRGFSVNQHPVSIPWRLGHPDIFLKGRTIKSFWKTYLPYRDCSPHFEGYNENSNDSWKCIAYFKVFCDPIKIKGSLLEYLRSLNKNVADEISPKDVPLQYIVDVLKMKHRDNLIETEKDCAAILRDLCSDNFHSKIAYRPYRMLPFPKKSFEDLSPLNILLLRSALEKNNTLFQYLWRYVPEQLNPELLMDVAPWVTIDTILYIASALSQYHWMFLKKERNFLSDSYKFNLKRSLSYSVFCYSKHFKEVKDKSHKSLFTENPITASMDSVVNFIVQNIDQSMYALKNEISKKYQQQEILYKSEDMKHYVMVYGSLIRQVFRGALQYYEDLDRQKPIDSLKKSTFYSLALFSLGNLFGSYELPHTHLTYVPFISGMISVLIVYLDGIPDKRDLRDHIIKEIKQYAKAMTYEMTENGFSKEFADACTIKIKKALKDV